MRPATTCPDKHWEDLLDSSSDKCPDVSHKLQGDSSVVTPMGILLWLKGIFFAVTPWVTYAVTPRNPLWCDTPLDMVDERECPNDPQEVY